MLDWLQEVADTPAEKKPYVNPLFTVVYSDGANEDNTWGDGKVEENGYSESSGAAVDEGRLKIITRDNVVENDNVDGDEPTLKEKEQVEGNEQYVIRSKGNENDSKDPGSGK